MNGADDLAAVDALEVDAGDAQVGVTKLALDDHERDALVRHLDGVSVPELVRREATSHVRRGGSVMQLLARRRGLPATPRSGSMDHAEDSRLEACGGSRATDRAAPTPGGPSRLRVACRPSRAARARHRGNGPDHSPGGPAPRSDPQPRSPEQYDQCAQRLAARVVD